MLNFVNEKENNESNGVDSFEDFVAMFHKVAFGGERVIFNLEGAHVAIVPLEDYEVLEELDEKCEYKLTEKGKLYLGHSAGED